MNYGQPGRIRLIDGKANFEMEILPPATNIKGQPCVDFPYGSNLLFENW